MNIKTPIEILSEVTHHPIESLQNEEDSYTKIKHTLKAIESYHSQFEDNAIKFAEWINENRYGKYWGSDKPNSGKWYVQYSSPNRPYFTTKELYEIFKQEKNKPTQCQIINTQPQYNG